MDEKKNRYLRFSIMICCMFAPSICIAQPAVQVNAGYDYFTKFKIEGAKMGINISYTRDPNDVQTNALFVLELNLAALNQTYTLANNGYRTVLLIPSFANSISEDLLTLFGTGIASEQVIPATNNLVIRGMDYSNLFMNLNVGISARSSVVSYLEPIGENASCMGTGYVSKSTNQQRCLAVEVSFGSGRALLIIVPRIMTGRGVNQRMDYGKILPIMDDTIEQLDNMEASRRLIQWFIN